MVELIKVAGWSGKPIGHVVFVHGFGGHAYNSWKNNSSSDDFWPSWLARDINGLTVWTLSYGSPATNWLGTNLSIHDQAVDVYFSLLNADEFSGAPIAFVCHGFGGQLIKQVLREAHEQHRRAESKELLKRIKAIIFIDTVHSGSQTPTLWDRLRFLVWPSKLDEYLVHNNSSLRHLNIWYRQWLTRFPTDVHITNEIFFAVLSASSKNVVEASSSDSGFPGVVPFPIEADHLSISKPYHEHSFLYIRSLEFLKNIFVKKGRLLTRSQKFENFPQMNVSAFWRGVSMFRLRRSIVSAFLILFFTIWTAAIIMGDTFSVVENDSIKRGDDTTNIIAEKNLSFSQRVSNYLDNISSEYYSTPLIIAALFVSISMLFTIFTWIKLRESNRAAAEIHRNISERYREAPLEESNRRSATSKFRRRVTPSTLYVQNIELLNVRCFKKLSLNFGNIGNSEPQLRTLVLGDNSSGKSTLLRAIALSLCNESDAVALMKSIPGTIIRDGENEAKIKLVVLNPKNRDNFTITKTITRGRNNSETLRQKISPVDFNWDSIFVCGYGTQRTAAATASFERYSVRHAVSTLFDTKANLQNPELVLLRRNPELRDLLQQKLFDVLMLSDEGGEIEDSDTGLQIRGPWGAVPFNVLSDGYRSTTQWLLDLFAWMIHAGRLPAISEPRGILLIDELEQHLHPRWQRYIMNRLSQQLPGVQIIASTHTPLIASGMADVKSAGIVSLQSDGTNGVTTKTIDPSMLQGMRADQVLTDIFNLATSRNPGSSDDLNRYFELRSKSKHNLIEEQELKDLEKKLKNVLEFGENEFERTVDKVVSKGLDDLLQQTPKHQMNARVKHKLRTLFPDEGGEV